MLLATCFYRTRSHYDITDSQNCQLFKPGQVVNRVIRSVQSAGSRFNILSAMRLSLFSFTSARRAYSLAWLLVCTCTLVACVHYIFSIKLLKSFILDATFPGLGILEQLGPVNTRYYTSSYRNFQADRNFLPHWSLARPPHSCILVTLQSSSHQGRININNVQQQNRTHVCVFVLVHS